MMTLLLAKKLVNWEAALSVMAECTYRLAMDVRIWQKSISVFHDNKLARNVQLRALLFVNCILYTHD